MTTPHYNAYVDMVLSHAGITPDQLTPEATAILEHYYLPFDASEAEYREVGEKIINELNNRKEAV